MALRLCCLLGVVEMGVWVGLGWLKTVLAGSPNVLHGIISYTADQFGNMTIGIATTAYVVFTYHLLESTEAYRRQSAEPYLSLTWRLAGEPASHRLEGLIGQLNEFAREWLSEFVDNLQPDQLPGSNRRFVIMDFTNTREVPLTRLRLTVSGNTYGPPTRRRSIRDQITITDLNLGRGQNLQITALDLALLPRTGGVRIKVDSLVYGPVEADVEVQILGGEQSHETNGVLDILGVRPEIVEDYPSAGGSRGGDK